MYQSLSLNISALLRSTAHSKKICITSSVAFIRQHVQATGCNLLNSEHSQNVCIYIWITIKTSPRNTSEFCLKKITCQQVYVVKETMKWPAQCSTEYEAEVICQSKRLYDLALVLIAKTYLISEIPCHCYWCCSSTIAAFCSPVKC